jgi:hypothetical protein
LIERRYRASKLDCMGLLIEAANAVRARPLARFCASFMKALAIWRAIATPH